MDANKDGADFLHVELKVMAQQIISTSSRADVLSTSDCEPSKSQLWAPPVSSFFLEDF